MIRSSSMVGERLFDPRSISSRPPSSSNDSDNKRGEFHSVESGEAEVGMVVVGRGKSSVGC